MELPSGRSASGPAAAASAQVLFILAGPNDRALRKRKGPAACLPKNYAKSRHTEMHASAPHYEITFEPLGGRGMRFVFPCDARGRVNLDALDERARNDYLFARAMVGRSLAAPTVRPCDIA